MTTETQIQTLKLDQIRIDGGTQPRVAIDEDVVAEYADLYSNGVDLPAVTVFHDGSTYWLADGFHRYWASKRAERETIAVDIQQGTRRDAILYSVGANSTHGLRRTNEDKRKAIQTLLDDEEWSQWSAREIARSCGVSHNFVAKCRRGEQSSLSSDYSEKFFQKNETASSAAQPRTYKTKHGSIAKMKTGNIGRSEPSQSSGFARNTYRPKACHSEHSPVPMRSVSLPLNNPQLAAKCMIGLYGKPYMQQLAEEAIRIITRKEGTKHDRNTHQ
jgi:uncharacterized ParB-like nuclease family protein